MNVQGKRIAITGGFGTLGAAVARVAAAAGAHVAAIDRADAAPGSLADAGIATIAGADIADGEGARKAIDAAATALGGLDALVNIAGAFRWETLADGSLDTWDLLYRINVRTAAAASKAALPHLRKSNAGRIINIGANAATRAAAGMGAYTASKAGVMRLTEALAEELKDANITVNAILPSIIDTPPNRADMPNADFGKWVRPEQLADVILFLVSDAASPVTGALVPVVGKV
ncbi:SDR family NAD(P)-dependent oxidoreductase [Dokdonella fugitiva]|jgi:NAD(P)-dependent dehydrogenase (short-subunit alcohol dehydrogenase family)|uniref:NADP-dependent 3-hydroxy acid dehydrogenase YdfG n=1 Tax=Dokdonella fugitiva TaxID=328517 RepID=A0A4R2I155_9GAMM|nr:SDR family NAD(P)-dependent oxidoreductase [Dokdonella fugitiva]TCO37674.1 NADP-dependent 3-hydroxy acid dehydrogenase YdfG [Dokdonella fugitiva]